MPSSWLPLPALLLLLWTIAICPVESGNPGTLGRVDGRRFVISGFSGPEYSTSPEELDGQAHKSGARPGQGGGGPPVKCSVPGGECPKYPDVAQNGVPGPQKPLVPFNIERLPQEKYPGEPSQSGNEPPGSNPGGQNVPPEGKTPSGPPGDVVPGKDINGAGGQEVPPGFLPPGSTPPLGGPNSPDGGFGQGGPQGGPQVPQSGYGPNGKQPDGHCPACVCPCAGQLQQGGGFPGGSFGPQGGGFPGFSGSFFPGGGNSGFPYGPSQGGPRFPQGRPNFPQGRPHNGPHGGGRPQKEDGPNYPQGGPRFPPGSRPNFPQVPQGGPGGHQGGGPGQQGPAGRPNFPQGGPSNPQGGGPKYPQQGPGFQGPGGVPNVPPGGPGPFQGGRPGYPQGGPGFPQGGGLFPQGIPNFGGSNFPQGQDPSIPQDEYPNFPTGPGGPQLGGPNVPTGKNPGNVPGNPQGGPVERPSCTTPPCVSNVPPVHHGAPPSCKNSECIHTPPDSPREVPNIPGGPIRKYPLVPQGVPPGQLILQPGSPAGKYPDVPQGPTSEKYPDVQGPLEGKYPDIPQGPHEGKYPDVQGPLEGKYPDIPQGPHEGKYPDVPQGPENVPVGKGPDGPHEPHVDKYPDVPVPVGCTGRECFPGGPEVGQKPIPDYGVPEVPQEGDHPGGCAYPDCKPLPPGGPVPIPETTLPGGPGAPVPGEPIPGGPLHEKPFQGNPDSTYPDESLPEGQIPGKPIPEAPLVPAEIPSGPLPGRPIPGRPIPGRPIPGTQGGIVPDGQLPIQPEEEPVGPAVPEVDFKPSSWQHPQCGKPQSNFQLRGTFPWQATLAKRVGAGKRYFCAGTLVGERHVLTPAHCVQNYVGKTDDLLIHLGNLLKGGDQNVYSVTEVLLNPDYNPDTQANDIAILVLASPATFDDDIYPICLPEDEGLTFEDYKCSATGWPNSAFKVNRYDALRKIQVPIMSNDVCQNKLTAESSFGPNYKLSDDFMCCAMPTGVTEFQACSGGALACAPPEGGRYVCAGIVNVKEDVKMGPSISGMFLRVTAHMPWIRSVLEKAATGSD